MKENIQKMVIGLTAAEFCVKIMITYRCYVLLHLQEVNMMGSGGPIAATMELSIQISSTASFATQASMQNF